MVFVVKLRGAGCYDAGYLVVYASAIVLQGEYRAEYIDLVIVCASLLCQFNVTMGMYVSRVKEFITPRENWHTMISKYFAANHGAIS